MWGPAQPLPGFLVGWEPPWGPCPPKSPVLDVGVKPHLLRVSHSVPGPRLPAEWGCRELCKRPEWWRAGTAGGRSQNSYLGFVPKSPSPPSVCLGLCVGAGVAWCAESMGAGLPLTSADAGKCWACLRF